MTKDTERQCIIRITDGQPLAREYRMAEDVNLSLYAGEHIAIVGPNGSGKSRLVDIILGRHRLRLPQPEFDFRPSHKRMVSENIVRVEFRDSYGAADRGYYLQQRWHSQEVSDLSPTVGEQLAEAYAQSGDDTPERRALRERLYNMFHLRTLLDKKVLFLSSGELRKFTLTKTLLCEPRVLILEEPFIGLDADAREQLSELLTLLSRKADLMLVLVLSRRSDVPQFVTHIVPVEGLRVLPKEANRPLPCAPVREAAAPLPAAAAESERPSVIAFHDVSIRYGERTILKNLTWEVRQGDHWSLLGPNGAGKSLLLSLVCADNPQRYACDIRLFGVPSRGAGQSIWDVKRRIGYVSPELHRGFSIDESLLRIVATGLNGQAGHLARIDSPQEEERCRKALRTFGLEHVADASFLRVSSGEQRLTLLARAFVSEPDMLILDEPLHGLDDRRREHVRSLIEDYCHARPDATLVIVTHYPADLPACIDHSLQLVRNYR